MQTFLERRSQFLPKLLQLCSQLNWQCEDDLRAATTANVELQGVYDKLEDAYSSLDEWLDA